MIKSKIDLNFYMVPLKQNKSVLVFIFIAHSVSPHPYILNRLGKFVRLFALLEYQVQTLLSIARSVLEEWRRLMASAPNLVS